MATVHIVGAGVSGLSAACALAEAHVPVKLYEATAMVGGRARTSPHGTLGALDHGLHLIPGHFGETFRFLDRIHTRDKLAEVPTPYHFMSQQTGKRWTLSPRRLLPAASLADMAALARMLISPDTATIAQFLHEENPLHDEWAANFARLRLHTPASMLSARALRREFLRGFGKRNGALHMVKRSLRETFLEPALHFLDYCGGSVYFSHALNRLGFEGERLTTLHFARKKVALAPDDLIILAGPPALAASLLPGIAVPASSHSAITLHFAALHREPPGTLCFLTDGPLDLLRYDEGILRATLRVADADWHSDQLLLAERIWRRLQKLHPSLRGAPLGEWGIWREKRAGHLLDLATTSLPKVSRQPHPQCILAGDWLNPVEPASLESATQSGHEAAALARQLLGPYPSRDQTY